jgi:oxidase EvaA
MIVDAGSDFPLKLPEGFIWLTLRQIAGLLRRDNLINACTRSILSCLLFAGVTGPHDGKSDPEVHYRPMSACPAGIWETLQWLDNRRAGNHMLAHRIGLNALQEWRMDEKGFFSHREKRFFRIVGMRISSAAREVRAWCQPIIENTAPGVIGLLVRNTPQGIEVLMQTKAEVGNRTTVQLGPTVQFTQGNYADSTKLKKPFLFEEFLIPNAFRVIHESRQAEEGARFYRECHVHRILQLPDSVDLTLPDDYRWLPLSHVQFLVHLGEQVNSCARSILTCLL